MASTNKKDQKETSLEQIKEILIREKFIEERNGRIYTSKAGQALFNQENQSKRQDVVNTYLNARREWDERLGYSAARETQWRKFAFVAMILCGISLFWNLKQSTESHIEPYLIAQDSIGTITPLGIPHKIKLDQAATETQIMVYLTALRSFSIDRNVNNRNIDIVTAMTDTKIINKIAQEMRSQMDDPQPTSVVVTNIQPIPDSNSFQVDWTEINANPAVENNKTYWRAVLVLRQSPSSVDKVSVPNNPFGLTVADFTIASRTTQ